MTGKPKISLFYSSESREIADTVQIKMNETADCKKWDDNQLGLGEILIDEIRDAIKNSDFCIIILTEDDKLIHRGIDYTCPRDNVVLELGLSLGVLGKERTFVIRPNSKNLKIPNDLDGIIYGTYDKDNLNNFAMLNSACFKIKEKIKTVHNNYYLNKNVVLAFSGADSFIKSEVVLNLNVDLSNRFKDTIKLVNEIATDLMKEGVGVNGDTSPDEYILYVEKHMSHFNKKKEVFSFKILDRTLIDVLAYANVNSYNDRNFRNLLETLIKIHVSEIKHYFFIPGHSSEYSKKIENEIKKLLKRFFPNFIELEGDLDEKNRKIIKILNLN